MQKLRKHSKFEVKVHSNESLVAKAFPLANQLIQDFILLTCDFLWWPHLFLAHVPKYRICDAPMHNSKHRKRAIYADFRI